MPSSAVSRHTRSATVKARSRLSSTHGPAMSANGCPHPIVMLPIVTECIIKILSCVACSGCGQLSFQYAPHPLQIVRRIDADGMIFPQFHHDDMKAVFQHAQLFQALGLFERCTREGGHWSKKSRR